MKQNRYLVFTENPDVADIDCFPVWGDSEEDAIWKFRVEHFPGWDYGEITAEIDSDKC